ncbi:rubredoxin domain protein [Oscillibacter sp. KLE 1728]|nr:rubredoxin domain protein [Oscillibacter sp. KLE 1745]ERK65041.1 rubredoxin domain protein [Oscillibacter sp. KLE 1728]
MKRITFALMRKTMSGSAKPAWVWRDLKRTARRKTAGDSVPLADARSSIMYRCDICGTLFDKPTLVSYSEIIDWDGTRESRREAVCPICGAGEQYFTEILKGDDDDT